MLISLFHLKNHLKWFKINDLKWFKWFKNLNEKWFKDLNEWNDLMINDLEKWMILNDLNETYKKGS